MGARWTFRQRVKNDLWYVLIWVALAVVTRLPRRMVATLCLVLAGMAWACLRRERSLVRARLEAGLGARVHASRVRAAFLRMGGTLADTLALLDIRDRAARTLSLAPEARDALREALASGRGVVFVSAHLGPWERLAALLVEEGFSVVVVARESYDPRLTALYERLRAPRGVRVLYRGRRSTATAVARELRAGRSVGFLIDLPARVPCARARLFGMDADVPVGAARVALGRRAAVVVGTCGPGRVVHIAPVETADLPAGRRGEQALLERLARELDARIAADPEAWLGLFAPPRRP